MKNAATSFMGRAAFSCSEAGVISAMILNAKMLLGFIILLPAAAGARMTVHPSPLCRAC